MSVPALVPIVAPVLKFVEQIIEWIDEGLDDEEIRRRIADPDGVGATLLRRARERRQIGQDLLGRDPKSS